MTIKLSLPLWLLTFGFVVFKLTGVITWSWWLVFSPVLIPIAAALAIVAMLLTAGVLVAFGVFACIAIVAIVDGL